jgi:hypothetical protein
VDKRRLIGIIRLTKTLIGGFLFSPHGQCIDHSLIKCEVFFMAWPITKEKKHKNHGFPGFVPVVENNN